MWKMINVIEVFVPLFPANIARTCTHLYFVNLNRSLSHIGIILTCKHPGNACAREKTYKPSKLKINNVQILISPNFNLLFGP
jgi:hypothetical protein